MTENNKDKNVIDLVAIYKTLLAKKKVFFIMWPIVFALSCLWVLPQPRYYTCNVTLAPEASGEAMGGGLASLASNFGFDLGSGGSDAIYPMLYPDLMESNEFVVGLLNIKVTNEEKSVSTDYYTYLKKHQKKNWLTQPFSKMIDSAIKMFTADKPSSSSTNVNDLNPFMLSEKDYNLVEKVKTLVTCNVDKKTDVITISVQDQDRVICATLADSVRQRLQDFITEYRTKKARIDAEHYRKLTDSTRVEYDKAVAKYSAYSDANQDIILQTSISERDKLEEDMQLKYNTYSAMKTQYEAMKARVQERIPAFTTLRSATVPVKPAGPKRMIFVLGMLILSTVVATGIFARKEIFATT